jgi:hypothetical protein
MCSKEKIQADKTRLDNQSNWRLLSRYENAMVDLGFVEVVKKNVDLREYQSEGVGTLVRLRNEQELREAIKNLPMFQRDCLSKILDVMAWLKNSEGSSEQVTDYLLLGRPSTLSSIYSGLHEYETEWS